MATIHNSKDAMNIRNLNGVFILILIIYISKEFIYSFLYGYELIHHRVTQSFTEFNQFEIKRIELRETLCYSVVKTHCHTPKTKNRLFCTHPPPSFNDSPKALYKYHTASNNILLTTNSSKYKSYLYICPLRF